MWRVNPDENKRFAMTSSDSSGVDDNLVRDLYLFFRLVCQRCSAEWERRVNLNEQFNSKGEAWAEAFAAHSDQSLRPKAGGPLTAT